MGIAGILEDAKTPSQNYFSVYSGEVSILNLSLYGAEIVNDKFSPNFMFPKSLKPFLYFKQRKLGISNLSLWIIIYSMT